MAAIRKAVTVGGTTAFVVGALALYGLVLWKAPEWLVNQDLLNDSSVTATTRLSTEHSARLIVISIGGALVVITGLLYTARNYQLARRGQVTERFTKALERLGSDELYVRIGGVRALEHVMRDSPEHHGDVVEVLVAFVRDQAPHVSEEPASEARWMHPPIGTGKPDLPTEPTADVQAALTALGQRPKRDGHERGRLDFHQLHIQGANLRSAYLEGADLRGTRLDSADLEGAQLDDADLRGAWLLAANLSAAELHLVNLEGARLQGANLSGSRLRFAHLQGAHLQTADLSNADLQFARMDGAHLQDACLWRARLQFAHLEGARLQGADLRHARLRDARLKGAQLQGANLEETNLTADQLNAVVVDGHTLLPDGPAHGRGRIPGL